MLTSVIGFVVGLSIAFRTQTAYGRYAGVEGFGIDYRPFSGIWGGRFGFRSGLKMFWDELLTE